jgi:hypothetical protein
MLNCPDKWGLSVSARCRRMGVGRLSVGVGGRGLNF